MLNKVFLIGRLGKNPEIRKTDKVIVANFFLATDESYKNKEGEKVNQTEWHNIVAYGKLAEIVEEYCQKGMLVYVEGKLHTRQWKNKNGDKQYSTEIVCNSLKILSKKNNSSSDESSDKETNENKNTDEDSPF